MRNGIRLQLREQLGQLPPHRAEPLADLLHIGACQVVPDRLQEGEIGKSQLGFRAAAPDDHRTPLQGSFLQLGRQPGLTEAGLSGQHHHLALSPVGCQQGILQESQLLLAANQDRAKGSFDGILPAVWNDRVPTAGTGAKKGDRTGRSPGRKERLLPN
jgi:hypothetical protein